MLRECDRRALGVPSVRHEPVATMLLREGGMLCDRVHQALLPLVVVVARAGVEAHLLRVRVRARARVRARVRVRVRIRVRVRVRVGRKARV